MAVQLGQFVLGQQLGRGGMGTVYRARDAIHGAAVAVKVLRGHDGDDAPLKAFEREVRAVAGLDHPGIVMVLDQGRVDAAAAKASGGELTVGRPYFVMELASAGSLSDLRNPLPWHDIHAVLMGILDALSHAHARGLVHRDLKPGNILLCGEEDLRPGLKLSDFGIATALDWQVRSGSLAAAAGTLHYMAPEQLLGAWRDYGPWTDLYAVGCLAWRLVTGRVPFSGNKGPALMRAQLLEPPPTLEPWTRVPEGFDGWVRQLLHKSEEARFQRAADAAWGLAQLPEIPVEGEVESLFSRWSGAPTGTGAVESPTTTSIQPLRGHTPRGERRSGRRPPIPASWEHPLPPEPAMQLVGAGLGLYGLRQVPMVGRASERDILWSVLRQTDRTGRLHGVLVEAPPGMGKSHLVRWFQQRAHEVGAATVIAVRQQPGQDVGAGFRQGLLEVFRTRGLDHEHCAERIDAWFGSRGGVAVSEVNALATLLCDAEGDARTLRALCRAFTKVIRLAAQERPILLWLDDVQHGLEVLRVWDALLEAQQLSPVPVLVVFGLEVEHPGIAQETQRRLAGVNRMTLGPLEDMEQAELVDRLLHLEPTLVTRIVERTAGNPSFAVQLIGDWVARDLFKVGPDGFVLREGVDLNPPESLQAVWHERLASWASEPGALPSLERAAVLGRMVSWSVWSQCGAWPEAQMRALIQPALVRGWLRLVRSGFLFRDELLRVALLQSARQSGRWVDHNLAVAGALMGGDGEVPPERAARVGTLLVEGGRAEDAIELLMIGATEHRRRGGPASALLQLERLEQVLDGLGVPDSDIRRGELAIEQVHAHRASGDDRRSLRLTTALLAQTTEHGWTGLRPQVLYQHGRGLIAQGEPREALRWFDELRSWARRTDDTGWLARSMSATATAVAHRGDTDKARVFAEEAMSLFQSLGDLGGEASALNLLAERCSPPDLAMVRYARAADLFQMTGSVLDEANCRNNLAELAREKGDHGAAEAGYRAAVALFERLGSQYSVIPRLNLALMHLHRAEFRQAHREAEGVRQLLRNSDLRQFLAAAHAGILPCAAADADWSLWDRLMRALIEDLRATSFRDADLAWCLMLSGEMAARGMQNKRARVAYRLARGQYAALRRSDEVVAIDAILEGLP